MRRSSRALRICAEGEVVQKSFPRVEVPLYKRARNAIPWHKNWEIIVMQGEFLKHRIAAKVTKAFVFLFYSFTPLAHAEVPGAGALLSKPLIIGASNSAGKLTKTPGIRVMEYFRVPASAAVVVAGDRYAATRTVPKITADILKDRSIILAIDLMFWDSIKSSTTESVDALATLINKANKVGLPLVIGDVPLLSQGQVSRDAINQKVRSLCVAKVKCSVLPLDAVFQNLQKNGYLEVDGKRYDHKGLLPDGLHLSEPAAKHVAAVLVRTLLQRTW